MPCLFCTLKENQAAYVCDNAHWYVIPDKFPASPGHALIILKTHKESAFDLDATEWSALQDALTKAKKSLDASHKPDAYNVGINDGKSAGRMIDHVHVHLIPRYASAPTKGGIEALLKDKK
ncbi:HIT family protein [Candidatus Micrarchaeota archaeon]|nr:HIT family protein [Candidatus Micrarchaeota archaeon]